MKERAISGFQLCYGKNKDERAFTWTDTEGFSHSLIDDGNEPLRYLDTPVLVEDGTFPVNEIIQKFKERSGDIDPAISKFIIKKIEEFDT